MVETAGGAREAALTPDQVALVAGGAEIELERRLAGIEGIARVVAQPADGSTEAVIAVGQSLEDRDETLAGVVPSFAVGGPVAVLVASLLGYLVASVALRPVEAMRRRAGEVSLSGDAEQLPLGTADDEIRRLGETLNEMLARLRESFDRERRFVADAGHEPPHPARRGQDRAGGGATDRRRPRGARVATRRAGRGRPPGPAGRGPASWSPGPPTSACRYTPRP